MKRSLNVLFISLLFFVCFKNISTMAAENNEVNINIPSKINIVFNSDGSNNIGNFNVENKSQVPITIKNINLVKNGEWDLVQNSVNIPKDTKKISLSLENKELKLGNNAYNILIPYNNNKLLKLNLKRGIWTKNVSSPNAFSLHFDYEIGKRIFPINIKSNGGDISDSTINAENGSTINLPTPNKTFYEFLGWKDEKGVLYNNKYVVPIGAVL